MLSASSHLLKVVDGRAHVYASSAHNLREDATRCAHSLAKMDPEADGARYVTKLKTCLLAEEDAVAAKVLADHYETRLSSFLEQDFAGQL